MEMFKERNWGMSLAKFEGWPGLLYLKESLRIRDWWCLKGHRRSGLMSEGGLESFTGNVVDDCRLEFIKLEWGIADQIRI